MLKRAHVCTFHRPQERDLDYYVGEFAGCRDMREPGTHAQMSRVADRAIGQRLRYKNLDWYTEMRKSLLISFLNPCGSTAYGHFLLTP